MTPRSTDRPERKQVLLRPDPSVRTALAHQAVDDLRSVNAQTKYLLRDALKRVGRLPGNAIPMRRPGRPPKSESG